MCWWQVWDVDDRFNIDKRRNNHFVTNKSVVIIKLPKYHCHQQHCRPCGLCGRPLWTVSWSVKKSRNYHRRFLSQFRFWFHLPRRDDVRFTKYSRRLPNSDSSFNSSGFWQPEIDCLIDCRLHFVAGSISQSDVYSRKRQSEFKKEASFEASDTI